MPEPAPLDRPALLAALRAQVARLEHGSALLAGEAIALCNGIPLPGGGLARAALHEVLAADLGAAAGFCALLLARAGGPVLWIAPYPDAWPPGLARFGLSPAELVLVQARRPADGLWAMEEALRCRAVAAALLVVDGDIGLAASRRLQLAAETGGALGLLLRPNVVASPSAALTRWRVGALPGLGGAAHGLGDPRWRLELLRCRGGQPGAWRVVWRAAAERLELDGGEEDAPPLAHLR